MYNYKLVVAYDGTDFCGYQVQKNARTVQGVMNEASRQIFGENATVTGASRTDSGVHANGQVILIKGEKDIADRNLVLAYNTKLPKDIAVLSSEKVSDDWHPRYQNLVKTYSYKLYHGLVLNPRDRDYVHHIHSKMDVEAMRKCAKHLVGKHDFFSYSNPCEIEDSVRTITDLEIIEENDFISIIVKGDGFLYNMLRLIVGTLIDCGFHKKDEDDIIRSLNERDRSLTGMTAPAKGLTLEHIEYLEDKSR